MPLERLWSPKKLLKAMQKASQCYRISISDMQAKIFSTTSLIFACFFYIKEHKNLLSLHEDVLNSVLTFS